MPFPESIQTIILEGTYFGISGMPVVEGHIEIVPETALVSESENIVILQNAIQAPLNEEGHFSVELPVSNDTDLGPNGFSYRVTERIPGGRSFDILLTTSMGETVDIADLSPVAPTAGVSNYLTVAAAADLYEAKIDRTDSVEGMYPALKDDGTLAFEGGVSNAVVFVSQGANASDDNDGRTPEKAKATIADAITELSGSGRIQLLKGDWPILISGAAGIGVQDKVAIVGLSPFLSSITTEATLTEDGAIFDVTDDEGTVLLKSITFNGPTDLGGHVSKVVVHPLIDGRVTVEDCEFNGRWKQAVFTGSNSSTCEGTLEVLRSKFDLDEGQPIGAYLHNSTRGRVIVDDCEFTGYGTAGSNQDHAIYAYPGAYVRVSRCNFGLSNGAANSAIQVYSGLAETASQGCYIDTCNFSDDSQVSIFYENATGGPKPLVRNCVFDGVSTYSVVAFNDMDFAACHFVSTSQQFYVDGFAQTNTMKIRFTDCVFYKNASPVIHVSGPAGSVIELINPAFINLATNAAIFDGGASPVTRIRGARYGSSTYSSTTANRPSASEFGKGAVWWDDTLNQAVVSNGTTWSPPSNIQVLAGTGLWTKPSGCRAHTVMAIGGGAGGASGRRGATLSLRTGGGGGGGGAHTEVTLLDSELGATENYSVGAAGVGGAAVTTDDTNGNAGTAGGNTWFGGTTISNCKVRASGGGASGGGNAVGAGTGGSAPGGQHTGGAGSASSATGAIGVSGGNSAGGAGGGASGGGLTTLDAASNGGTGGQANGTNNNGPGGGTAGGSLNGVNATASGATTPGHGGGGGASSTTAAAGSGGNGAAYGGGGGGGGASQNGFNSGKGGDGGAGVLVVVSW